MILLDSVVGHFLPGLFGWIFLFFVLAAECLLLSKYLSKNWVNKKIFLTVIISNIITTIIGYIYLDQDKIGGHLLNWVPVEYYGGRLLINSMLFLFISSFIWSLIVEAIFNWFMLKKDHRTGKILLGTTWVNLFTYVVGGLIIFLFTLYDAK